MRAYLYKVSFAQSMSDPESRDWVHDRFKEDEEDIPCTCRVKKLSMSSN